MNSRYNLDLAVPPFVLGLGSLGYLSFMAQRRSFSTVDPSNSKELPQSLQDIFPETFEQFPKHLKTSLFVVEDQVRSVSGLSGAGK